MRIYARPIPDAKNAHKVKNDQGVVHVALGYSPLVRRPVSPKAHRSEGPLVRRPASPKAH